VEFMVLCHEEYGLGAKRTKGSDPSNLTLYK